MTSNMHPNDLVLRLINDWNAGFISLKSVSRAPDPYRDAIIFRAEFEYVRPINPPYQNEIDQMLAIKNMIENSILRVRHVTPTDFEVEGSALYVDNQLRRLSANPMASAIDQFHRLQKQILNNPTFAFTTTDVAPKLKPRVRNLGVKDEVIVAYRDFDIGYDSWDNVWLKSRNGVVWPGYQPMIATCGTNLLKLKHDAPQKECECGIYAFNDPKHKDLQAHAIAWGEVALYGEVFICETGYRAEYAYPKTIFLRDNGTKIQKMMAGALEENYGVPVHISSDRTKTTGVLLDEWLAKATK